MGAVAAARVIVRPESSLSWRGRALALTLAVSCAAVLHGAAQPADQELTLRIIVVGTTEEASQVLAQLERGDTFEALARRLSLDTTADQGGLLGRIAVSSLRPELREALRDVSVGQVTAAVPIPTGFAVVKVVPDEESRGTPGGVPNRALSATGSVKYVLEVGGFGVSSALLLQHDKPAGWNLDPATICRFRKESLAAAEGGIERDVAGASAPDSGIPRFEVMQWHFLLGQLNAYQGKMDRVIEQFEQAFAVAMRDAPAGVGQMQEALGVAHLHKAELDNGVQHGSSHRCLLSAAPDRPLEKTADVEKAIGYFTSFLQATPGDLEVRWLLNLAHMAAGSYPAGVPAAHLIEPQVLRSSDDIGRFVDVAARAGLVSVDSAGGVIVDDFDGDGRFDVVTTSMGSCDPMRFFRRSDSGMFSEQTAQAGLSPQLGGLNAMQADYDNDGHLDILVLRGGWELAQRKSLLRNNGDGTFSDVTMASGLGAPDQHADGGVERHQSGRRARSVRRQRGWSGATVRQPAGRHLHRYSGARWRRPQRLHEGRGGRRLR